MSKRAEEAAFDYQRELGMIDSVSDEHIVARRMGFYDGYRKAEKDINKEMMDRMAQVKEAQEANVDYGISFKESELPIDELLYLKGRKDAEKDLALTWEDIEKIVDIHRDVLYDNPKRIMGAKENYEDTLRKFNEWREKK